MACAIHFDHRAISGRSRPQHHLGGCDGPASKPASQRQPQQSQHPGQLLLPAGRLQHSRNRLVRSCQHLKSLWGLVSSSSSSRDRSVVTQARRDVTGTTSSGSSHRKRPDLHRSGMSVPTKPWHCHASVARRSLPDDISAWPTNSYQQQQPQQQPQQPQQQPQQHASKVEQHNVQPAAASPTPEAISHLAAGSSPAHASSAASQRPPLPSTTQQEQQQQEQQQQQQQGSTGPPSSPFAPYSRTPFASAAAAAADLHDPCHRVTFSSSGRRRVHVIKFNSIQLCRQHADASLCTAAAAAAAAAPATTTSTDRRAPPQRLATPHSSSSSSRPLLSPSHALPSALDVKIDTINRRWLASKAREVALIAEFSGSIFHCTPGSIPSEGELVARGILALLRQAAVSWALSSRRAAHRAATAVQPAQALTSIPHVAVLYRAQSAQQTAVGLRKEPVPLAAAAAKTAACQVLERAGSALSLLSLGSRSSSDDSSGGGHTLCLSDTPSSP